LAHYPTLTSNVEQVDATNAIAASNENFIVVEQQLRNEGQQGLINSFTFLLPAQHAFRQTGTVPT